MVELRKRPAPKETATPAPAAKRSTSRPKAAPSSAATTNKKTTTTSKTHGSKAETKATGEATDNRNNEETATSTATGSFPLTSAAVGQIVPVTNTTLNQAIKLNTDTTTTISQLLDESTRGIVIFSYPKASTPGCTTQACLFRDSYTPLTDAGLKVYGLSADSPKSNTTFVTKHDLPFPLICDTEGIVSAPLGLKKPNPAKGTVRGVVVLSKVVDDDNSRARVEVVFLGGPQKTLDVVLDWIGNDDKKSAKL